MTDADLANYRQAHSQGFFQKAAHWVGDHCQYFAAAGMVALGVGLMFIPGVGTAAGIALMAGSGALISGGLSIATQKATTGKVDVGKVLVDATIGGATGALGGVAFSGLARAGELYASFAARSGAIVSRTY